MQFNIGDIVYLKSGSEKMVVSNLRDVGDGNSYVEITWWWNGSIHIHECRPEMLDQISCSQSSNVSSNEQTVPPEPESIQQPQSEVKTPDQEPQTVDGNESAEVSISPSFWERSDDSDSVKEILQKDTEGYTFWDDYSDYYASEQKISEKVNSILDTNAIWDCPVSDEAELQELLAKNFKFRDHKRKYLPPFIRPSQEELQQRKEEVAKVDAGTHVWVYVPVLVDEENEVAKHALYAAEINPSPFASIDEAKNAVHEGKLGYMWKVLLIEGIPKIVLEKTAPPVMETQELLFKRHFSENPKIVMNENQ